MDVEPVAADPIVRLFDTEYRPLLRAAYLLLGSHEEAEDVVQEAFVRLAGSLWRLRRADNQPAYLRTCVLNGARSRLRKRTVVDRYAPVLAVDASGTDRIGAPAPRPEESVERGQVSSALRRALDRLPERQRECVVLRYYLGLSEDETARAMGVSRGSVKTHHSRAVAALGNHMEAYR